VIPPSLLYSARAFGLRGGLHVGIYEVLGLKSLAGRIHPRLTPDVLLVGVTCLSAPVSHLSTILRAAGAGAKGWWRCCGGSTYLVRPPVALEGGFNFVATQTFGWFLYGLSVVSLVIISLNGLINNRMVDQQKTGSVFATQNASSEYSNMQSPIDTMVPLCFFAQVVISVSITYFNPKSDMMGRTVASEDIGLQETRGVTVKALPPQNKAKSNEPLNGSGSQEDPEMSASATSSPGSPPQDPAPALAQSPKPLAAASTFAQAPACQSTPGSQKDAPKSPSGAKFTAISTDATCGQLGREGAPDAMFRRGKREFLRTRSQFVQHFPHAHIISHQAF